MLGLPEKGTHPGTFSTIYFGEDDPEGTLQALTSRGVVFEGRPHLIAEMPDHRLWAALAQHLIGVAAQAAVTDL
jgi:hypothetical protein